MTVSDFVAKTQKRRRELIWADAGAGNKWIAYPPGQKPAVEPSQPAAKGLVVYLDRDCERTPIQAKSVAPLEPLPLARKVTPFMGVEPLPAAAANQPRRTSSGRFVVGDLVLSRITGRHGPVVEIFGQKSLTYRIVDDDGVWPVADRHAERCQG